MKINISLLMYSACRKNQCHSDTFGNEDYDDPINKSRILQYNISSDL